MTELLLIRHGRPESGSTDPALNDEGKEQARRLARHLKDENLTGLVCSDMLRARQTAQIVGEAVGLEPLELPGLREWGWQEQPDDYIAIEVLAPDNPQAVALAEGRFMDFIPAGVDLRAFREAVVDAFDKILAEHPEGRVAVACHGGTINAYIGQLLGVPDIFWFHPAYTSISRLESVGGGRVVVRSLNEAHHLLVE